MEKSEETTKCCEWRDRYMALEKRVADMQEEMKQLKTKLKKENTEVRTHFQHFYKYETDEKAHVKELKDKLETLSNIVIRIEEQLNETNEKLIGFQARSMRKNLIISGLEEPKNESEEQLRQAVKDFIQQKLKVTQEIPIKVCHRLNYIDGAEFRPVVIKLSNIDHKSLLLSNGPNLKGLTNSRNRFFYLNEQLPEKLSEDRRYAQHWIRENKAKPTNDQLPMKITRNALRINNVPYKKKIKAPSAAEILRLDPEELSTTRKASTVFGDSKLVECSEFISYAAKISTIEDVRVAYRKLRIKYADATHIMSAYRLDPPNGPFNQEGTDDGEYGAGRALVTYLQDIKIVNVAVFVIRFYGGKKIGPARFDVIKSLARTALHKLGAINAPAPDSATNRRTTRSMSQRGRKAIRGARQNSVVSGNDSVFQTQRHSPSMYRPTPVNSPNVSPTHDQVGGGWDDYPLMDTRRNEENEFVDANSNPNTAGEETDEPDDEEEPIDRSSDQESVSANNEEDNPSFD